MKLADGISDIDSDGFLLLTSIVGTWLCSIVVLNCYKHSRGLCSSFFLSRNDNGLLKLAIKMDIKSFTNVG